MTDLITEHVKLPGGVTAVLERPGARLVYEVAGDGPAVVLIHGFGLDMRMWDPQIWPLAARVRVARSRRRRCCAGRAAPPPARGPRPGPAGRGAGRRALGPRVGPGPGRGPPPGRGGR